MQKGKFISIDYLKFIFNPVKMSCRKLSDNIISAKLHTIAHLTKALKASEGIKTGTPFEKGI